MGRRFLKTQAFDFLDYRAYLRAAFLELKERGEREGQPLSLRGFSRMCGFQGEAAIKLVMDGLRGVSEQSISRIVQALRMPGEEMAYFQNLVRFNDGRVAKDRDAAFQQLTAAAKFRKLRPLDARHVDYHRHWYLVAIRELAQLDDFQDDPAWVARNLSPPIGEREAAAALRKLVRMELLKPDENGRLRPTDPVVTTAPEVAAGVVKGWHKQMLKLAEQAMETQDGDERDIRAATVAISQDQAERIKRRHVEYIKEILAIAAEPGPAEVIYQMNLQWFRLSSRVDDESRRVAGGSRPAPISLSFAAGGDTLLELDGDRMPLDGELPENEAPGNFPPDDET